jgi:protein tyrosine phosphatase (PTP) superfamily phosphohydrolase (DUF442 family)
MPQALALGIPLPLSHVLHFVAWHAWCSARRWIIRAAIGLVVFLVVGNLLILGASVAARALVETGQVAGVEHIDKLRAIDGKVWRGAAPGEAGYEALAAAGVTTVVDLRAEDFARDQDAFIEGLGMKVVHLPIRDGQTPTDGEVAAFLDAVKQSPGQVFFHCGAGIGRTGAMASAYLSATDQAGATEVLSHNLAIGPPSLEQIVYAVNGADDPNFVVKGVSRVLDGPRRIWHNLI